MKNGTACLTFDTALTSVAIATSSGPDVRPYIRQNGVRSTHPDEFGRDYSNPKRLGHIFWSAGLANLMKGGRTGIAELLREDNLRRLDSRDDFHAPDAARTLWVSMGHTCSSNEQINFNSARIPFC